MPNLLLEAGVNGLTGLIAGSIVAVTFAAFKLVERIAARKDANGKGVTWSPMDREKLNRVESVVSRTDAEGVPMSYVPRRLVQLTEAQTDLMRQMAELVREQTKISGDIHAQLKGHEAREEEELKGIRHALDGLKAG